MLRLLFFAFILAQSNRLLGQELKHTVFPMSENALLWKIEGPNVKKDCYLFGTMHLIEKDYFFFPEKTENYDNLELELQKLVDNNDINAKKGLTDMHNDTNN
jgi:uncharacterized protein YbaP (TraB family)